MSVKLNSSGGGSITLQEPSTASNRTLTLPDNTGTVVSTASTGVISQAMLAAGVAGNGPAFSAYQSSAQTISSNTWTKLSFQTEEFDTASCFDAASTYRFTPNVAGYYQLYGGIAVATSSTYMYLQFYKNGSGYKVVLNSPAALIAGASGSILVYLNGLTDYVELYAYLATGQALTANLQSTYFQGALVRAA